MKDVCTLKMKDMLSTLTRVFKYVSFLLLFLKRYETYTIWAVEFLSADLLKPVSIHVLKLESQFLISKILES